MRLSKYHTVLDDDDDERRHVNRNQENVYSTTSRHHLDQISYTWDRQSHSPESYNPLFSQNLWNYAYNDLPGPSREPAAQSRLQQSPNPMKLTRCYLLHTE